MHMPLEGIRVLEWSQWQQGPVGAMMLADLGAEVIKIEEPIGGDQARGIDRVGGVVTWPSRSSKGDAGITAHSGTRARSAHGGGID